MSKYLWCEDSGSGYQFWKEAFAELYPDFIVETKQSNTRLRRAASRITDDGNEYFILMDCAADNPDVIRELKRLYIDIRDKSNVRVIKIHSFEFALLSFELLEKWIFAAEDELKNKRSGLLEAGKLFVRLMLAEGDAEELAQLKALVPYSNKLNTERLAARLLEDITRNTGFETNKSTLGQCFIADCCEWTRRMADDICGLDKERLTSAEKKKLLVERSVIKAAFEEAGL